MNAGCDTHRRLVAVIDESHSRFLHLPANDLAIRKTISRQVDLVDVQSPPLDPWLVGAAAALTFGGGDRYCERRTWLRCSWPRSTADLSRQFPNRRGRTGWNADAVVSLPPSN